MPRSASDTLYSLLAELALDVRWSWDRTADELWHQLNPELWESTRNTCAVFQGISRERIGTLFSSPPFREMVLALAETCGLPSAGKR